MDLSSIIPLLSNLTNKGNPKQTQNTSTQNNLSGIYPDETFDGQKITTQQNTQQQAPQSNNGLFSLLPKLLGGNNGFDLSSLTSMLGGNNDLFSSLLSKTEDKKTNSPKISEFVKVDEYDLN